MNFNIYIAIPVLFLLWFSTNAIAIDEPTYKSKYIGQEKRSIKSLSDDDIEQLSQGRGWGLAKAAELNGMPGPVHVLQMKDKIALTQQQEQRITALYEKMKAEAIPLGNKLIDLERDLNLAFEHRDIDDQSLKQKLEAISAVRTQLRYVHLKAHLETPKILSEQQISTYNQLRGYGSDKDPCTNVPPGHDPRMWRMHNGCQ